MGFHYLYFAFFFRNLLAYIYIPVLQKELDVFGVLAKIIRACKQENNDYVHQLGSVITAERKLSVTLFMVSAASTLTLFPWVITAFSKIQLVVYYQCCILIG